MKVDGLLSVFY